MKNNSWTPLLVLLLCLASTKGKLAAADNISKVTNLSSPSDTSQREVRMLFERYKAMDLANNPQLICLYRDDANINVVGTPYTKASYGQYLKAAYGSAGAAVNSHTNYGLPEIQSVSSDTCQVKFLGTLGAATMTVYWTVKKNRYGVWQIASERFVNGRY